MLETSANKLEIRFSDGLLTVGEVSQRFVAIPPGTFQRGPTTIVLSQGFWLATTPVTQAFWRTLWGQESPGKFQGDTLPVDSVDWFQAVATCDRLNTALAGITAQLPTTFEWEYAARAGGPADPPADIDAWAWHQATSGGTTQPVGRLRANAWGLHDMLGNIWEWCRDWKGTVPEGVLTDPEGPSDGFKRAVRGGSWSIPPQSCRCDHEGGDPPEARLANLGFRLVLRSSG